MYTKYKWNEWVSKNLPLKKWENLIFLSYLRGVSNTRMCQLLVFLMHLKMHNHYQWVSYERVIYVCERERGKERAREGEGGEEGQEQSF